LKIVCPGIEAYPRGIIACLGSLTLAGGIQGTHVEDVDALHLSDELQTLETGSLDEVGGDGTGLGTGGNQVILRLDLFICDRNC